MRGKITGYAVLNLAEKSIMHYHQIMEYWITAYGYWVVLFGTILEGETIVLIAGYLAHQGYLDLAMVIGMAATGAIIGDHAYFLLGKWKGEQFLQRHPGWRRRGTNVLARLERHQIKVMLGFRYLYGLRTITPFMMGMTGVSLLRFSIFNISGSVVWAVVISVLGYAFGKGVATVFERAHRYEAWILGIMVGAACLLWLYHKWKSARTEDDCEKYEGDTDGKPGE